MIFNPKRKKRISAIKKKRKKRKFDNSTKIIFIVSIGIMIWATSLTIKSVINYKEVLKIYKTKKHEYEFLKKELQSKEKELEILRRTLENYEPIRGDDFLQTQPTASSTSKRIGK